MKKYGLALIIFSSQAMAQVMPARWHELDKLVKAEIEMLENAKKKGDEVHYRLLELYSEKLKLTLEKENKAFLEAQDGKKHNTKEAYFSKSIAQYGEARAFGEKLLSMYPESKRRGAIYYTMGLNSRDYGRDKRTEQYFLKAMELIRPGTALHHHAQTSLADFYYNDKRFPEAIKYYEVVVQDKTDDWLPKHLLNLGWCYLKANRHDDGIAMLKKSYEYSQDKKYVDIREQTLQHLAAFFVYGDRVNDGREFYLKNEQDPLPYMLSLAKRAADKGHGKQTEEVLDSMQDLIIKRGLHQHQEDLVLYELDFYRTYKRYDDHLKVARKLLELYQRDAKNPELKLVKAKSEGVDKVRDVAGYLQMQTAKDVKKNDPQIATRDMTRTVDYFKLLRVMDPERKDEYAYYIGETYYALHQYSYAYQSYNTGLEDSKALPIAKQSKDRQRKILNSLLALTGEEVLEKKEQRQALIYTYENHVNLFPKDDVSHKIYVKLFKLHREDRSDDAAVSAIDRYSKNYPEDLKTQQGLMKELMDDFIKAKEVLKITHWIAEFKKGFLKFDGKTIEDTEIILGQILFTTAQEKLAKGERKEALQIFDNVFKTMIYPEKVRALAAIQAGELQLDMAQPMPAMAWMEKSIELLKGKELDEKTSQLTTMVERMAYMREFRGAVRTAETLLKKSCKAKSAAQDRLWQLSVNFHLVLADDWITRRGYTDFVACASKPEMNEKIADHIMWYYWDMNDADRLVSFWNSNKKVLSKDEYVTYLLDLYWDQPAASQRKLRRHITELKDHAKIRALVDDFQMLEAFQNRREKVLATVLIDPKLPFTPEGFNPRLEAFLLDIKKVGEEVQPLLKSEHFRVREQTNQQLQAFYNGVADMLQALKPEHSDKDFVTSFQVEMFKISKVFQAKVVDFKKAGRRPSGDVTFASPVNAPSAVSSMDKYPGDKK